MEELFKLGKLGISGGIESFIVENIQYILRGFKRKEVLWAFVDKRKIGVGADQIELDVNARARRLEDDEPPDFKNWSKSKTDKKEVRFTFVCVCVCLKFTIIAFGIRKYFM